MKAKYKEKFDRYILSIGLIVKNEEKNLRACLESLKPLREAVPSELIIVDTGSEDATVQIAQEYTDKVYSFEWINDFAAARNYGLDRAAGKWFMYLDADEQLAFPNELIQFFSTESQWSQYNTVLIPIHSILDRTQNRYSEFLATRIFRLGVGNRFHGAIHEVPLKIVPIKKLLQTRLDHYGYLFETKEEMDRKYQRNNILLEAEMEKNPDDPRLIHMYAASGPMEKRLEMLEHGLELVRDKPEDYFFPCIYWRMARELSRLEKYEQIVELAEEYNRLTTRDHVGEIEIAFHLMNACYRLERNEEMLSACKRYLDLYNRYQDGSLIEQDSACDECEMVYPAAYNFVHLRMAHALENLERYEEAFDSLMNCDLNYIDQGSNNFFTKAVIKVAHETQQPNRLIEADKRVRGLCLPEEREDIFISAFVDNYLQQVSKGPESAIWPENTQTDTVFEKLVYCGTGSRSEEWLKLLGWLTEEENQKDTEKYGPIAIYFALKNQWDLLAFFQKITVETIQKWNMRLKVNTKNLGNMLVDYPLEQITAENICVRFWLADLETRIRVSCSEEYKLLMAHRITEDLSWYVNHLYNDDILTPEGICVLPSAQRFAYWCGKALEAKKQGDTSGYVKLLGEASRACPEMAEVAKLLIQEVRDNDETLKAQREQQELAGKIKGIIEGMILAGNQADAQSILAQYELIAPNDPDIPALKAAILQQPALTEL